MCTESSESIWWRREISVVKEKKRKEPLYDNCSVSIHNSVYFNLPVYQLYACIIRSTLISLVTPNYTSPSNLYPLLSLPLLTLLASALSQKQRLSHDHHIPWLIFFFNGYSMNLFLIHLLRTIYTNFHPYNLLHPPYLIFHHFF